MAFQREHYWLCTGEILCKAGEDDPINGVRLNTVVTHSEQKIPVALLGKIQQGLQLQFHKNMNDASFQVVDVVILNITYLGHFTPEQFHAVPEGKVKVEMGVAGNA